MAVIGEAGGERLTMKQVERVRERSRWREIEGKEERQGGRGTSCVGVGERATWDC